MRKYKVFAVYDEYTGVIVASGTLEYCRKFIREHDGAYYIEEY